MIRTVAEIAHQGLAYDQIRARAESFLTSPEAVPVNDRLWTTPEILALEAEALDWVHNGRRVFAVPEEFVHRAIAQRPSLSPEQAEAVEHITMTDAPVAVVVGPAGAGLGLGSEQRQLDTGSAPLGDIEGVAVHRPDPQLAAIAATYPTRRTSV